jgi:tetratricopeptide (TPR) repeat protein
MLGQLEEALRLYEAAIPLIETGGDLLLLARARNNAGAFCESLGRMQECRRYTEQALRVVERIGNPDRTAFVLAGLGSVLVTLGDWKGAKDRLDQAMGLVGEERPALNAVLTYVGRLALYQGRWEEAERSLREALAVAQRGERALLENAAALLAELEVQAGRPEQAVRRLEQLAAAEDASLIVFPPLARALLEAGAVERAEEVVTGAIRRARAEGQRFYLLEALRVQGVVLDRQDRLAEAEHALREGLELARSLPYPYAEGILLYQLGLLERRRGAHQQVREHLEAAHLIFQRLGALKDVERTEEAL